MHTKELLEITGLDKDLKFVPIELEGLFDEYPSKSDTYTVLHLAYNLCVKYGVNEFGSADNPLIYAANVFIKGTDIEQELNTFLAMIIIYHYGKGKGFDVINYMPFLFEPNGYEKMEKILDSLHDVKYKAMVATSLLDITFKFIHMF